MATVQGTLQGLVLAGGSVNGADSAVKARKTYLCTFTFGAVTATDVVSVTGLNTSIQNMTRNGRTFTIRGAGIGHPGTDTSGNPVYCVNGITAGTTAGQVDFVVGGTTAQAAVTTTSAGVGIYITGDET